MGIYSRDYLRDESPRRPVYSGTGAGSAWKGLIIATVVVFVLQQASAGQVTSWLVLQDTSVIERGQIWRLLTYAFCHSDDIFHILFNMLFVWWFGKTLEQMYGSREFLWFYLAAAVFAGLCNLLMGFVLRFGGMTLGASGAVMAIMMVYAMHFPRQQILVFGIIPVEVRWLVAGYVVFNSLPVLKQLAGQARMDDVANTTHLGGLLFGYLYCKSNIRLSRVFDKLRLPNFRKMFGPRSKIKIYQPPKRPGNSQDLNEQVDTILAKIHEHGESSLTDSERETLKQASQQYKNR